MIRHTRKASVLIAFCVLTSAATASAECAWVLWEQMNTGLAPVEWKILRVSADMTSCEAVKARTVEVAAASPPTGYARERRGDSTRHGSAASRTTHRRPFDSARVFLFP